MRAAQFSRVGGPEVLGIEQAPMPEPQAGEARIRVHAAALQPFDRRVRSGGLPPGRDFPIITGNEFAGVVEALGPDTPGPAIGTRVAGRRLYGAAAEYLTVPVSDIAEIPAGLDFAAAATLGGTAQTADTAIDSLGIGPADVLLIQGAAGGIGSFAVQLARLRGATVIGTGSPANADYIAGLGAIPLAPGPDLAQRLAQAAPAGLTAIIDCVGGPVLDQSLELGVPPGRIASFGDLGRVAELGLHRVEGVRDGVRLARLLQLAAAGSLVATVRRVYPLEEIVAAHRDLDTGHGRGKIVVAVR